MPRPKGESTTHLRLPKSFVSEVKRFQKKKGISTLFEAMKLYLSANKDWKKALIKREAQIEEKFKREYSNRLKRDVERYVKRNADLEIENRTLKENVDVLQLENERKDKRINKLELETKTLKAQTDSEIEKLKAEIERFSSDETMKKLKREIITLKEEKAILNERLNAFERMKEEIKNTERLLEDYERLKEEASQNPRLRKMLNDKAKEIKFIRDAINNEVNRILEMSSTLDIKPTLAKLKEAVNKKADFELEKHKEMF